MGVDEYLDGAPEPQRSTLLALRSMLRELLPDTDEALSYGVPAFVVGGRPVAGYAWAKRHCSYYPHSSAVLTELAASLDGYDWSKGTLRFAVDQPLPRELVARLPYDHERRRSNHPCHRVRAMARVGEARSEDGHEWRGGTQGRLRRRE
jgi:uncharacterized protein YdhG (YjbR/CyaY superfamily)